MMRLGHAVALESLLQLVGLGVHPVEHRGPQAHPAESPRDLGGTYWASSCSFMAVPCSDPVHASCSIHSFLAPAPCIAGWPLDASGCFVEQ